MDVKLSDAEKIFLIHGCELESRNDGRSCEDFRPIVVERGVLANTDGSARVRLENTDVLVGVKCEVQTAEDTEVTPNRLRFSVDCSANASPEFEGKGGELFAEDIVSALEAAYDNDFVLPDIKKLLISNNHIWVIYVDVVILQCGGSIIDAISIGVKAALSETEICVVNAKPADEKKSTIELPDSGETWNLDTKQLPVIVTVSKIGTSNVVDCSSNEEVCVRAALLVAVTPPTTKSSSDDACTITMVRQCAGGSLEKQSVEEMLDLAVRVSRKIHTALEQRFEEEEKQVPAVPGSTFLL